MQPPEGEFRNQFRTLPHGLCHLLAVFDDSGAAPQPTLPLDRVRLPTVFPTDFAAFFNLSTSCIITRLNAKNVIRLNAKNIVVKSWSAFFFSTVRKRSATPCLGCIWYVALGWVRVGLVRRPVLIFRIMKKKQNHHKKSIFLALTVSGSFCVPRVGERPRSYRYPQAKRTTKNKIKRDQEKR